MKIIKDPVYGYIEIERKLVPDVVDTPNFQRLRNVRQTSYAPLYPSAEHSRFCHSLGVYYLGKKAFEVLEEDFRHISSENLQNPFSFNYEDIKTAFLLACLLHDIGHAPFSHTGEYFYDKTGGGKLLDRLKAILENNGFNTDIEGIQKLPKNHELMSAIIGVRVFGSLIPERLQDFFARCITGYKYRGRDGDKACDHEPPLISEQLLNCYIELLHSATIDVDRLDYLIRDAYVSGYQGVSIDYVRLLNGICIHKDGNGVFRIAFSRLSLSIIENVIYAHDSEAKWIQSHPTVLYGHFIAGNIITKVDDYYRNQIGKDLFSEESLLPHQDESDLEQGFTEISLLSDDDIFFLAKNHLGGSVFLDYISRDQWRHPIWKSEAEYNYLLLEKGALKNKITHAFNDLTNYQSILHGSGAIINESFISNCEDQLEKLRADSNDISEPEKQKQIQISIKIFERRKRWGELFKEICEQKGIRFSIVILSTKLFQSSFSIYEFKDIQMCMNKESDTIALSAVSSLLSVDDKNRTKVDDKNRPNQEDEQNLFYIFYDRKKVASDGIETISAKEFIDFIESKSLG